MSRLNTFHRASRFIGKRCVDNDLTQPTGARHQSYLVSLPVPQDSSRAKLTGKPG